MQYKLTMSVGLLLEDPRATFIAGTCHVPMQTSVILNLGSAITILNRCRWRRASRLSMAEVVGEGLKDLTRWCCTTGPTKVSKCKSRNTVVAYKRMENDTGATNG